MGDLKEILPMFSICSSNTFVLRASLKLLAKTDRTILIESTSNQVNQDGGYTGMKPEDFSKMIVKEASRLGIPKERIILGGDHLGPLPYRDLPPDEAMEKAKHMVWEYVKAGYRKIHLDTSFPLGDEEFSPRLAAERQAQLCEVSEAAWRESGGEPPFYILGTEVPPAGGGKKREDYVTDPRELENTIQMTKEAFEKHGLRSAWKRVVAFVVQPGVEFYKNSVRLYERKNADELKRVITKHEMVLEAHSTDFQPLERLAWLVEDGFHILKVGPEFTFKFREGVFALESIAKELFGLDLGVSGTAMDVMEKNPKSWEKYYGKDEKIFWKYSLLDRIRYYWNLEELKRILEKLFKAFEGVDIPLGLISQHFPEVFYSVLEGDVEPRALDLVEAKIQESVRRYLKAVSGS